MQEKRRVFGFRGHTSSESCFYCTSPATLYKTTVGTGFKDKSEHSFLLFAYLDRRTEHSVEQTLQNAETGACGFIGVPAVLLNHVNLYDTPVDILHNFGNGLCLDLLKGTEN